MNICIKSENPTTNQAHFMPSTQWLYSRSGMGIKQNHVCRGKFCQIS